MLPRLNSIAPAEFLEAKAEIESPDDALLPF
jgi:hypothetical protein